MFVPSSTFGKYVSRQRIDVMSCCRFDLDRVLIGCQDCVVRPSSSKSQITAHRVLDLVPRAFLRLSCRPVLSFPVLDSRPPSVEDWVPGDVCLPVSRSHHRSCVCPHRRRMNWQIPVPSHLGGRLPATPAPPALDDQQLLVIEGPKKPP